jgi:hypothetical protein
MAVAGRLVSDRIAGKYMVIAANETKFYGLKIEPFVPGVALKTSRIAPRIVCDEHRRDPYKNTQDTFTALRADPKARELKALVIGPYAESYAETSARVVAELTSPASLAAMPVLEAIFLGEMTFEEQEISWISVGDLGPLLDGRPALKHLRVRGTTEFELRTRGHTSLDTLIIESGGLPRTIINALSVHGVLPNLSTLSLWLGSEDYGADHSVDDLMPILSGRIYSKLTTLGLCNSEYTDEIAQAIADAPILSQLETLDLSYGTLGDAGALALINSPRVKQLKNITCIHHYISEPVQAQLRALGPNVTLGNPQVEDGDERYIYCAE